MPPKKELSDELNDILDTELTFNEMRQDDLEQLHNMVTSGDILEPIAKYTAKEFSKDKVDRMIEEWYPLKYADKLI